jgi:pyruvate formate lyase activating enzyme
MVVAGLQKNSLIDYPGKISCVVFLSGCNFACPYCHNPDLARGAYPQRIPPAHVLDFIAQRKTLLEGAVITGGEPTLAPDLTELCNAIRDKGLAVKLDTNGSRPEILAKLINGKAIDFIAMDVKTAPVQYGPPLCPPDEGQHIQSSIDLVMNSGLPYEFRTTCVKPFIDTESIKAIGRTIEGARQWTLQTFTPTTLLSPDFFGNFDPGFSPDEMDRLHRSAAVWVRHCTTR